MTTLRKILFTAAISATLLLLYFTLPSQGITNNPGEVGIILAGAAKVLALYAAIFSALLAAIAALWHYKAVRFGLIGIATLMIVIPTVTGTWHKIENVRNEKFWKEKRLNNDVEASIIVARYDKQLDKQGDDIAKLIDLRTRFQDELYTKELGWASGGSQDFYWKHSLYIWVFVDDSYPADEMTYRKMGYVAPDKICDLFYQQFGDKFVQQRQTNTFRKLCPQTAMN